MAGMRFSLASEISALAVDGVDRAGTCDQAWRSLPGNHLNGALDLLKRAGKRGVRDKAESGRVVLDRLQQGVESDKLRIEQHAYIAHTWRRLFQQLEPLACNLGSNVLKPVTLAPGRDRFGTYPAPTGLLTTTKTTGKFAAQRPRGIHARGPVDDQHLGAAIDEIFGLGLRHGKAAAIPSNVDINLAPVDPPRLTERAAERLGPQFALGVVLSRRNHEADPPAPPGSDVCARVAAGLMSAAAPTNDTIWRRFSGVSPMVRDGAASYIGQDLDPVLAKHFTRVLEPRLLPRSGGQSFLTAKVRMREVAR